MKKLFLIIVISVLFAVNVNASPFLACDPPEAESQVDGSQIEMDGTWEAAIEVPGCTEKQPGCTYTDLNNVQHFILRDLSGVADGQHTVRARFVNVWGEGEISDPFVFDKNRPGKRSIRLIP